MTLGNTTYTSEYSVLLSPQYDETKYIDDMPRNNGMRVYFKDVIFPGRV